MENRSLKDLLYEQVARIGKAVSSPKRLELLELLAQGEKTVETLAAELAADIKLTSALSGRLVRSRWIARVWRTELAFFLVVVRMNGGVIVTLKRRLILLPRSG